MTILKCRFNYNASTSATALLLLLLLIDPCHVHHACTCRLRRCVRKLHEERHCICITDSSVKVETINTCVRGRSKRDSKHLEITSHHKTHVAISSAFSQYPPVRLSFRPLLPPPVREPRDWVCSTDRIGRRPASAPLSSRATMVLDRSKRAAKYNGVKPYSVVSSSTRAPAAISFFTAPTCPALAAMCSALAPSLTPLH